jgi:hypothetical protein
LLCMAHSPEHHGPSADHTFSCSHSVQAVHEIAQDHTSVCNSQEPTCRPRSRDRISLHIC